MSAIKWKPWRAPNFALVQVGEHETSVPLKELSDYELNDLVGRWLQSVYQTAGKQSPWRNEG